MTLRYALFYAGRSDVATLIDASYTVQFFIHRLNDNLGGGSRVDLLTVLVESDSLGRSSNLSALSRSDSDNLGVDGARHAVLDLEVELGQHVLLVDGGLGKISDGGGLDHVSDGESLDGLVLGLVDKRG